LGSADGSVILRELAARGLLVALSGAVAVGSFEVVVRVTERKLDPRDYTAFQKSRTPGLDYEFIPGATVHWANRDIRINAQGFRGPDFREDESALRRVAVIGDSIAAGYGVAEDEALPFRMGALMLEQELPAEVLGFGVPGYNIQRIVVLWEQIVRPYRPFVVVYAMCLNDARPELMLSPEGVLVATGTVELRPERSRPGRVPIPGKEWLRQHSRLYGFAMSRYDILLRRLGLRSEPLPPLDEIEQLYADSSEGRRFRALLGRLAASVEASGARLVMVCFPSRDQLTAGRARPQAALRAVARKLGIEFVDLYPAFLSATMAGRGGLFQPDGVHPGALGHALAAGEVVAALRPLIIRDAFAHGSAGGTRTP
jgi:lysophospholipase L1-like esterase